MITLVSISLFVMVNAILITDTFVVMKNKQFLMYDSSIVKSLAVRSKIECASECQNLGEACCGGHYETAIKQCVIGITGCCHTELENVNGSSVFHRKSKRTSLGKIASVKYVFSSKNVHCS